MIHSCLHDWIVPLDLPPLIGIGKRQNLGFAWYCNKNQGMLKYSHIRKNVIQFFFLLRVIYDIDYNIL